MKNKLVVTDLDGTVLFKEKNTDGTLSQYVKPGDMMAVEKLRALGSKVVVCTGRNWLGIQSFTELAEHEFDYYVGANGAIVADKDWNTIYKETLDTELVNEIVRFIDAMFVDVSVLGFATDDAFRFETRKETDKVLDMHNSFPMMTLSQFIDQPFEVVEIAMALIDGTEEEQMEKVLHIEEKLRENFGDKVSIYRNYLFLDISPKGNSKATGMKKVQDLLGVETENVIAIGDSWNDESMLKAAGTGVTFTYAEEALQEHADLVVDSFEHMVEIITK